MRGRLLRRLLGAFLTCFLTSLLLFLLMSFSDEDPVLKISRLSPEDFDFSNKENYERQYVYWWKKLALDKPLFYFSVTHPQAYPKLYEIPFFERRKTLERLAQTQGDGKATQAYYTALQSLESELQSIDSLERTSRQVLETNIFELYRSHDIKEISTKVASLEALYPSAASRQLREAAQTLANARNYKYFPKFIWHGLDNRYHSWLYGVLRFDFGISYLDGKPVARKIKDNIGLTLFLGFTAITIAYALAIILGFLGARYRGSWIDKVIATLLYIAYALPNFWVAVLLIAFLTNPDYLMLFPAFGLGDASLENDGLAIWLNSKLAHLVLPVFCLSYGYVAYLSRQMRNSLLQESNEAYMLTARAKGLSFAQALKRHALKNAFLPIVTIMTSVFPLVIAGSVVIESIFALPGIGRELFQAIIYGDKPTVLAIVMLISVFTVFSYWLADVVYMYLNPRVRIS